ncbi:unnamed protein product, partial [Discosporangium mesarthrocarpum]
GPVQTNTGRPWGREVMPRNGRRSANNNISYHIAPSPSRPIPVGRRTSRRDPPPFNRVDERAPNHRQSGLPIGSPPRRAQEGSTEEDEPWALALDMEFGSEERVGGRSSHVFHGNGDACSREPEVERELRASGWRRHSSQAVSDIGDRWESSGAEDIVMGASMEEPQGGHMHDLEERAIRALG